MQKAILQILEKYLILSLENAVRMRFEIGDAIYCHIGDNAAKFS